MSRSKGKGHFTLLERFVKTTSEDGSLIVKAPMHLKCLASYFDLENKVDGVKNHNVGQQREEATKIERSNRQKGLYAEQEEEESSEDQGPKIFLEEDGIENMSDISPSERNILDNLINSGAKVNVEPDRTLSPIQISLWGRSSHRVDSYSILSSQRAHTHVYISDATSSEGAISMFSLDTRAPPVSGRVDIWRPREVSQVDISPVHWEDLSSEEVMSTFKVYCPTHLLQERANGLSMTFHTPTLMNKIFLETEGQACIDLNGNLMDQLVAVGLVSEGGDVKIRDIWAEDIMLASASGDILCYGTLEATIKAETGGDGDFIARSVVGPKLEVLTNTGNISVWDDCHSESALLLTTAGNIYCNRMYSDSKICIKEKGVATLNIVNGSVDCVVNTGDIITHIDNISQDSFLEVQTGDIVINIKRHCSFRISLVSPATQISPHILNSGEFYMKDGLEYFVSGTSNESEEVPSCLTVRCHSGLVTFNSPPPNK